MVVEKVHSALQKLSNFTIFCSSLNRDRHRLREQSFRILGLNQSESITKLSSILSSIFVRKVEIFLGSADRQK